MKSTAFFFIVCLLTSSFASKTEFSTLESSKLGKTLLDTLQIHLSSKEPIQNIITMLNDMAATLAADQADADSRHSEFQDKCLVDAEYYNTEISEAQNRVNTANSELESLRPELATVQQSQSDTQANLEALQEQLASATSQRETEAEEYNLKVEEHENALTALHDAQSVFQELASESSASFLQKKSNVFIQVHGSIKKSIPSIRAGYQGIFKLLAQIVEKAPVQADQDIISKIVDLIKKIRENVENSARVEKDAEEQRVAAFEELSATLQQNINNAQSDIVTFTNKIESLNSAIQADEEEVEQQTERVTQRQEQLNSRSGECNNEIDSYDLDLTKRF